MLYLLDTNVLSEMLKGNPRILSRLHSIEAPHDVEVPVVAWYEIVRGRMSSLLNAADKEQLLLAQSRLDADLIAMHDLPLRGINEPAAERFEWLCADKKCKMMRRTDLLIACFTLANQATLVTRNVKDFANVPGLRIENWFN